ncbi:protein phosphatase 2C domain-containing protein [Allokutzneria sp. A3M-2-11 16]|uniref:PP2C family protein-serine/threonine phosphatase n=1 Tax=Allokutzneria sp. A3M-2-11 16 TaxID=2962043 RepID=UPI0020B6CE71|nr:PP2C family serine/threonine-protein phosphatase [Allokutzneria sp. A3M-2-11 16]MCP3799532.1 protein phosphatase 2C domain-containing protein [Allokutzneria sp. A3M-2-11 16]
MTLVLRYAARSDRGLVRSNNQDSVYAGPRVLALADGMGGHAAGEVASKVVIAAMAPLDDDEPGDDLISQLRDAVIAGNAAISELVQTDPELEGMGTTLTAVLFAGNKLGLVHVGDSRAYLLRDGVFSQITHDDTFVQSLIDEGRITEEEATTHPQRSLLLRALTGHEVEPSFAIREARAGDRFLLCSDGLSGPVSQETLDDAMRIPDPQACADRLIELALRSGGPDNVTCIVADVVDVDYGENDPIVGGAAGDGSEDPPPPDTPAARASAINPQRNNAPQRVAMETPPPPKRRSKLRGFLITLLVLALLAGGGFVLRWWVLQQYYVGVNEQEKVAIFQGLRGDVLGFKLQREVEGSCAPDAAQPCEEVSLKDLKNLGKDLVRNGITNDNVDGIEGARMAVRRLRLDWLLPVCPAGGLGQLPNPTNPTNPSGSQPPPTTTTTPVDPNNPDPNNPQPSLTPKPTPGVDCRTVG